MADLVDILNKRIIHFVIGIEFQNLRELNLNGNNIESVEAIHRIGMPNIKKIRL